MRRQLLVEPQQVRMFPHVTDDVVGHHGFHAVGKIAGHPRPPTGVRCEQAPVDCDRKVLPVHDVLDRAQAVLPTLRNSRGIERGNIKLNTCSG
jgi:hypothetical protein